MHFNSPEEMAQREFSQELAEQRVKNDIFFQNLKDSIEDISDIPGIADEALLQLDEVIKSIARNRRIAAINLKSLHREVNSLKRIDKKSSELIDANKTYIKLLEQDVKYLEEIVALQKFEIELCRRAK